MRGILRVMGMRFWRVEGRIVCPEVFRWAGFKQLTGKENG
jgi:hypothetical protein